MSVVRKIATVVALAAPIAMAAGPAHAECQFEEVIELVEDGASHGEIRGFCKRQVESNCSLSTVIRYAEQGKRASYMAEKCPAGVPSAEGLDTVAPAAGRSAPRLATACDASAAGGPGAVCPVKDMPQGRFCRCGSFLGITR